MNNYAAGYIRIRRVPTHAVNRVKGIAVICDNAPRHFLKPHIQAMIIRYNDIIKKTEGPQKTEKRDMTLTGYSQKTIDELESIANHIGVSVSDLIKVELFLIADKYQSRV